MTISEKGIALIKEFEALRLEAYPDPATGAEPITIGYGSTRDESGLKFKLGDTITKERADDLLHKTVNTTANKIRDFIKVTLSQTQFDACCDFAYNVGVGAFVSSTLLKKINNNPNDPTIRNEFLKWNKGR